MKAVALGCASTAKQEGTGEYVVAGTVGGVKSVKNDMRLK